jgi:serine/threonine protein phosphatase PrpC
MGILAVARSFGDAGLKPFVTAQPHTSSTNLGPSSQHPFFILACDGIWDVLEDQEAVDIVLDAVENKQQELASSVLLRKALSKGSTDNITCMVVFL